MKKLISFCLFLTLLLSCFTGCTDKKPAVQSSEASATIKPSAAVTDAIPTEEPEETYFIVSFSPAPSQLPSSTAPASPTPTPVPTPTPTIRPAQVDSIVPEELLTTGYTTPLNPKSVKFPENYNMPYYIEVDVTNQCVNIFRKNPETGAYDILLNRFVTSGGTSSKPTKTGNFYIKTEEQQKAATGQSLKYVRYYFQKYGSYAYYITRYSNEYMFHSFTFEVSSDKKIVPKSSSYYNMGNTGSAGCLRMLMGHAKWIYENIDGGTYCVVNKNRARDNNLRAVLKKYVPPLGYDMTPAWDGNRSNYTGLVECDFVNNPQIADKKPITPPPVTPTPPLTPTPTPTISVSPEITPSATPNVTPVVTPGNTPNVTPSATPGNTPVVTPDTVTPTVPPETPSPTAPPAVTPTQKPDETPTEKPAEGADE